MTGKNTYLECSICILPTLMLIKMLTLICKKYQVTSMTTDGLHNTGVVASSVRKSIGQLFPLTNHYSISVFQDSVIVVVFFPLFLSSMLYRDLLILYYKYNLHLTLLSLEFISRVNFSCELQTSESNFLLNIFTRMFHKHCHNSVSKTQHLFIYLFFQIAFYCHCLCHSLHLLIIHYPKFLSGILAIVS